MTTDTQMRMIKARVCPSCGGKLHGHLCDLLGACGRNWSQAVKDHRNEIRRARHQAYLDCGMVRVKGMLGGTYYE